MKGREGSIDERLWRGKLGVDKFSALSHRQNGDSGHITGHIIQRRRLADMFVNAGTRILFLVGVKNGEVHLV